MINIQNNGFATNKDHFFVNNDGIKESVFGLQRIRLVFFVKVVQIRFGTTKPL